MPTPASEATRHGDPVAGNPSSSPHWGASGERVNILLVDDRPANLVTLDAVLSSLEQNIVRATSGAEALRTLAEQDFAVVILDVQMPVMDGFETAQRIRKGARNRDVPLIFLTAGSPSPDEVARACEQGASDFVEKPFNPELLRSKVAVLAELYRKTEQLRRSDAEARRQFSEEQLKRSRLASLSIAVGLALTTAESLREMLERCTSSMVEHLDAAFARVWTLAEGSSELELQASSGLYTHINGAHARVPVGKFKIGRIAQERKPHLTNDVQHDPRVGDQEWARREGMVAFAGYPLVVRSRLIGVLAMFARQPLPRDTLELMGSIADSIALGIERKVAEEDRLRYTRQLRGLAEAAVAIQSAKSLEEMLQTITDRARAIVGAHQSLTVLTAGSSWAQSIHAVSLSEKYAAYRGSVARPEGTGIYAHVCRTNQSLRATQAELERHPAWGGSGEDRAAHLPSRGWLAVPIVGRTGENLGLIQLSDRNQGEFTASDEDALVQLAQMAAAAVENTRLLEESQSTRAELEAVLDHAPVAISLKDADGRYIVFNRAAEIASGIRRDRVLGSRDEALLPASEAERLRALDEQVIATRRPVEVEESHTLGEQTRTFQTVRFPVFARSGVVRATGTIATDITELKRGERALREHSETLEILNKLGAILAAELDTERLVQGVTDAATQLTGAQFGAFFYNVIRPSGEAYTLYTISGVPREKFSRFPMPRNTQVFAPTFAGEGVVRVDDILADPRYGKNPPYNGMPEGHLPVRSYLAVPVVSRAGVAIGGLFFGHERAGVFDERSEKLVVGLAAQAAVAMDNARLFEEAQRLIRALERSNAELDQFAYIASHDLKAPLRGIANLAQWIEEDLEDSLSGETRRNMDLLRGRVQRMEALIDGILDYSRAGRVRTRVEPIELSKLLVEVVELLAPKPPARVEFAADLPTIESERVPLQQIFMNLIGNALKHAKRSDPVVTVTAVDADASAELVEFAVSDNGQGIAPEYHERIWTIFQTLEARDKLESTGIGLAVVKKIVESRGGRAWVESALGEGATFRFTWPKRSSPSD